ncbi:hypothetical protein HMPREF1862_01813 [Varibaculum cambriense]|uniref:Uncharacterized protein n=1 Tax=Varibaculum cambriense TaxID=184870 RepID=A0AB34WXR4_9ACTO|nr:hypothetical protein [Varibaculum cambriense]KXB79440.1 hypothetical protein HMPREF1862_01813 [Varibaculum cambriense]
MSEPIWQALTTLDDQVTWAQLLNSMPRFYHYSPANAYQIAAWQAELAKTNPNLAIGELALTRAGWNHLTAGGKGRAIKKTAKPLTLTFLDLEGQEQTCQIYTYSQTYGRKIRKEALPTPLAPPALQDRLHTLIARRSLSVTRTHAAPKGGRLDESQHAIELPENPLTPPLIHATCHIIDQTGNTQINHDGSGEIVAQAVTYALCKHIGDPDSPPPPRPPARWAGGDQILTADIYSRAIYAIRKILSGLEDDPKPLWGKAALRRIENARTAALKPPPVTSTPGNADNASNTGIADVPGSPDPRPIIPVIPLSLFTPNEAGQDLNLTIAANPPDNEAEKLASRLRTLKVRFDTVRLDQNPDLEQTGHKAGYKTGPILFAGNTPLMEGAAWHDIMRATKKARTLLPVEQRPDSRVRGQKPYQLSRHQRGLYPR